MEIDIIKLIDDLEKKVQENHEIVEKLRTELTKRFPMCPYAEGHKYMLNERCEWCNERINGH